MLDFLKFNLVPEDKRKKDVPYKLYPQFKVGRPKDLMIKGGVFYAIWDEENGVWSTDEYRAYELIDKELYNYYISKKDSIDISYIAYIKNGDSGSVDKWKRYTTKQLNDRYIPLDEKLVFANDEIKRENYSSKTLSYSLLEGDISAYDRLMSVLYSPKERHKLEWAVGSIISGDSVNIQKFVVMYGSSGTGKSTFLNIVQQLFEGHYSSFDAKELGMANSSFALEPFKNNPLVAIQHDGDLSKIDVNTRLNSIVSHEELVVNEKHRSLYTMKFNSFLFIGTNSPVKITDINSGILRRLIDVSPTGNLVNRNEYNKLINEISFELGAIAKHCLDVYLANPNFYNNYRPLEMMGVTNHFYDFMRENYDLWIKEDIVLLKTIWSMYKEYAEETKVYFPLSYQDVKEEAKGYFEEFYIRKRTPNGQARNIYSGFIKEAFSFNDYDDLAEDEDTSTVSYGDVLDWLIFADQKSVFDEDCKDCQAQYASSDETPISRWDDVNTKLCELDTSKVHYVRVPENHIVIDFDISDEEGNKSLEKNLEEANKWPKTYAELSKSGKGIHLHYIYNGDVNELSRKYADCVEVKVFTGKSSLRRKLSKCNDISITTITSGLPLKEVKKVIDKKYIVSEKNIRNMILRNIRKEFLPGTKPSIDFIDKILNDAYSSGIPYDVSDMHQAVLKFAAGSHHQAEYCIKKVATMKFMSEEPSESIDIPVKKYSDDVEEHLVFYDVEVFPNLFLLNWKKRGLDKVFRLINPSPTDISNLIEMPLVGFNCRRYDNHILYARIMGYDNKDLYILSQRIISGDKNAFFGEAYNISYTDIYDFASAGNKMSLKKLEIEMGIHHQELGLPWDQPVPEELWEKVAEYCDNDVIATEAAFDYLSADWTARKILADVAEMSVNDTTNSLTTRIIFKHNKKPQNEFQYRNLAEPVTYLDSDVKEFLMNAAPEMMSSDHSKDGIKSILPFFPGYSYTNGKSVYKGVEVGEGGRVFANPGIYYDVALLDIASMHPHSVIAECLFGVEYTKAFKEIVDGRVTIKHEAWDKVNDILDGKLAPYIQMVKDGKMTSKQLANALKTAINSVYGLTAAKFNNAFRDPRNFDNIVAKRGALFMVDLQEAVEAKGFTVAHIKTDSIKVPNATPEIIQFIMDFGKKYGYSFEHEATYEKMCLVNDAVYIAKYKDGDWTATGTQFAVPYVFKTLFSKEDLVFSDFCETKSVKSSLYLDMNEGLNEDEHNYEFIGRIGQFCPIKEGAGGGELVRTQGDKYYSVTGTKGYRWLESETVKTLNKEEDIDISYYEKLANDAIETISKYGDFNNFINN